MQGIWLLTAQTTVFWKVIGQVGMGLMTLNWLVIPTVLGSLRLNLLATVLSLRQHKRLRIVV